jgi:hypothetical protein
VSSRTCKIFRTTKILSPAYTNAQNLSYIVKEITTKARLEVITSIKEEFPQTTIAIKDWQELWWPRPLTVAENERLIPPGLSTPEDIIAADFPAQLEIIAMVERPSE